MPLEVTPKLQLRDARWLLWVVEEEGEVPPTPPPPPPPMLLMPLLPPRPLLLPSPLLLPRGLLTKVTEAPGERSLKISPRCDLSTRFAALQGQTRVHFSPQLKHFYGIVLVFSDKPVK